ncbi:MAG: hypothetical protein KDB22_18775 [Planctomycetales bacterium]|nr:hypothetical protein [Planctomycetales bacterium]
MGTANIDDALALVSKYFRGVTDKDGVPYVMHCLRVMMGVSDTEAQLVALMHDLVEDTPVTLNQLEALGFSQAVVQALDLVTHRKGISYADYVVALRDNSIARQVKLSDLRDNTALHRVLYRSKQQERDLKRIQRYILSYQYLEYRIDEAEYRAAMARFEE